MSQQASTKIEDLPDNNKTASDKILQELDDNESYHSEDEEQQLRIQQQPVNIESGFKWDDLLEPGIDAIIVFALVFILSNSYTLSILSNIPYIKNLEPHSIIFNVIISAIVSLLFLVIKYYMKL